MIVVSLRINSKCTSCHLFSPGGLLCIKELEGQSDSNINVFGILTQDSTLVFFKLSAGQVC